MRVISGSSPRVSRALAMALSTSIALLPVTGIAAPAEPAAAAVAPLGGLSIATDPIGATVYVDGQYAGLTPLVVNKVSSGDHRVRVAKDGFLDNSRVVNVATGQPKSVSIQMTRDTSARRSTNQISGGSGGGGKSMLTNPYVLGGIAGGGALAAFLLLRDSNKAPVPGTIGVSPTGNGMANQTNFTFTSNGSSDPDGDSLTYEWDFGDTTTGTGASTTHRYTATGTYTVKLTVKDDKTSSVTPTASVVVVPNVAGTWTGGRDTTFDCALSVALTQSGTALTGGMSFVSPCFGTIPMASGSVSTALTHPTTLQWQTQSYDFSSGGTNFAGLNMRFSGTTNAAGTSVTGTLTLSQPSTGASIPMPATFTK